MKTKLFTQNLCLGLLMALVLALGVQGTAEAVKDPKLTQSSSDFFKFRTPNTTFSISTGTLSFDDSAAEETVTITVSSGITLTDAFIGQSSPITLTESDADGQSAVSGSYFTTTPNTDGSRFSRSLTIKGRFAPDASAEQTVAISSSGWADTYTYYYYVASVNGASDAVVTLVNGSGALTFFDGSSGSGYAEGDFGDADIQIVTGAGNNPVLYNPRTSLSMSHDNYKSGEKVSLLSGPISSAFNIHLKKNTSTDVVTAQVRGPETDIITGVYIYSFPTLEVDAPTGREKGSEENPGKPGEVIANAFTATVKDGKNRGVPGVPVKFEIPAGSTTNGELGFGSGNTGTLVDESNQLISNGNTQITSGTGTTLYVRTNSSGKASVNCRLITGNVPVTVTAVGESDDTATAYTAAASGKQLTALSARSSLINADAYDLFVLVTYNGEPADPTGTLPSGILAAEELNVIFRTSDGNFGTTRPNTKTTATPNAEGIAQVSFTPDSSSSNPQVTASLEETNSGVTRSVDTVTFDITGSGDDDDDDDDNQPITRTISISPSTITGEAGTTQSLTVSAGTATVRVADASAFTAAGGTISGSGTTRSITLPDTPGSNYRITFGASGYTDVTVPVIVTAPLANGTLTLTLGTRTGDKQPITVRAVRGGSAQSDVNLTITGGTTSVSRQTEADGRASAIITLQTATSAHTLTVRATGYNPAEITVPAPSQQPPEDPTPPTTGVADSVRAIGEVFQSGTLNTQLDLPLSVRVLDANGRGVENAKVTFRVRDGQGRLSQRGNGRGIIKETDSSGHARATYTPMSASSTVRATAAGVSQTVTFTITTGAAPPATGTPGATRTYKAGEKIPLSTGSTLNFSGSRTVNGTTYTCVGPGECVVSHGLVAKGEIRSATTPTVQAKAYKVGEKIPISLNDTLTFTSSHTVEGTTYTCVGPGECVVSHGLVAKGEIRVATKTGDPPRTTAINPVVHVAAAQRPPMLWIDGGAIYALVGADVQRFAPSVDNALNLTVGGGKVYWTEQTGESRGTINSANLNGSGVTELASIQAVPMGIAVDVPNSKLYWTNSRGRIQSANLDGSRITNELQNLPGPKDIAVARGNVYWTQYDATAGAGSVGIANSMGRGTPKHISTGSDTPGSLVISGNKVYWTEMTGTNSGTINIANLNGTGAMQLASILAMPVGIAVDAARSTLYWGNARGRIQAANLDGSKIKNVVDGLGSPGDMVISNSLKAPAGTTTAPKTTTAANKYDVNGDGTVDSKDSDALVVAVAAGITDAKYDVNGDGKVDINDLVAVSANRSAGAAGAPTLLGMKLSALEIDRLQEQIELLIATGDRSPAAMKTLIYLQQLIALARPDQTQLFANYPNPFNPETWMPYELATDTNVKITIYNPQGVVIRTLVLGHQSAGYYTDRERAAYWDGRNALGEQVASGIYFYQLETDELSLMRKMVILK